MLLFLRNGALAEGTNIRIEISLGFVDEPQDEVKGIQLNGLHSRREFCDE